MGAWEARVKCSANVQIREELVVSLRVGCFASDDLDIVDGDDLLVLHLKVAVGDHQRPHFVAVVVMLQVALSEMQSGVRLKNLSPNGSRHTTHLDDQLCLDALTQRLGDGHVKLGQHLHGQDRIDVSRLDELVQGIGQVHSDADTPVEKVSPQPGRTHTRDATSPATSVELVEACRLPCCCHGDLCAGVLLSDVLRTLVKRE